MYKFLKDKTVIYIEDEQDIRENVTELLSDYFLDFLVAQNAEEGYEIFQKNSIDIIITDIEMGDMNGLELLEKILDILPIPKGRGVCQFTLIDNFNFYIMNFTYFFYQFISKSNQSIFIYNI